MEHSGPVNITFQIESFCYKLMKKLFCLIYREENEEYLEEIDLENPPVVVNDYNPLKKRSNNINIDEIVIEEYFEV
tara:strand:- start:481 stop:708 length:228 start_codon:yes stop_codon:yes gene_type:complete